MSLVEPVQRDRASPASDLSLGFRVSGVTKRFGDRTILDDFNLEVQPGEFTALLGKSGSGKTTLLRILADLDKVDDGRVLVPRNRSVVFQEPRLIPSSRVWRNVLLGLSRADATRDRAVRALQEVGLADRAESWPHTLSGGEAQRAALARALVRQPKLLLLDEPFAALDAQLKLAMHALLLRLAADSGQTVVFVTHDLMEAVTLADRVIVCTRRPAMIALEQAIPLPRPRDVLNVRFSNEFKELYDALWERLRVEYHEERV
jgi:sulfonate transport system ATP-binding protein